MSFPGLTTVQVLDGTSGKKTAMKPLGVKQDWALIKAEARSTQPTKGGKVRTRAPPKSL